jgi:hypothetical protein
MTISMKTHLINFTTQSIKNLPGIPVTSIHAFLVVLSLFVATPTQVFAVDAVWLLNPGSGDWNTGSNWSTSPTAPVNPGDTATFNTSGQTSLTLSGNATVESITFQPGASAFTISNNQNVLTVQGAGIVNNSGNTQTNINNGGPASSVVIVGTTEFMDASTAGNMAIINNGGFGAGRTLFSTTSTAGSAAITNNGGAGSLQGGGFTEFLNNSTAGNATITNHGGTGSGGGFGDTEFLDASTAGNAAITNNGGGRTIFRDTSTAGNAMITTNGGTGGGFGGETAFLDSSDGGSARAITNGNGSFDISGLTTPGMRIGSIEGSGNYFLGSKTLSVGGNNLSTMVSGVIQDGGLPGGPCLEESE